MPIRKTTISRAKNKFFYSLIIVIYSFNAIISFEEKGFIIGPIQWVTGTLYPRVKRPRPEADHSPPTSVEVKKTWMYTPTPTYVFMV
jgi:hypothetical protein